MSYDRLETTFLRQCVFIGSTNDRAFLVDPTGNRRFWPIPVNVDMIDTEALAREIDGLWADAVRLYREMRAEQPDGDLPLFMTHPEALAELQEQHEAVRVPDDADILRDTLRTFLDGADQSADFEDDVQRRRKRVSLIEVRDKLNFPPKPAKDEGKLLTNLLRSCGWEPLGSRKVPQPEGKRKSQTFWVPGSGVIARWALEDRGAGQSDEDALNLI